MGVVIRRWVWLECIGVVSGCCKEVYRFPHILLHLYQLSLQQHQYLIVNF